MCPVGGCFLCVCSVSLDKVGDISALEQRDTTQQHLTNFLSLSLVSPEIPSASQERRLSET